MRLALFALALSSQAATLTIDPPVIYDCTGTFRKATVRWKDASGPVQVLVGPSRAVFTGIGDTSGAAETGTWVGDGLEFRLVNQRGETEALTVAHVACGAQSAPESYFPLQPGNTWTYRVDSRAGTSMYATWTVSGMRRVDDRWYSDITATVGNNSSVLMSLREEAGIVYRRTGSESVPREEIYVHAAGATRGPFRNSLGSYPDAVFQTVQTTLNRDERVFVRGVGLARTSGILLTGSSGGFTSSMELIEFRLATGQHVETPASPRISLSMAKTFLDVTGKQLENCAIPCYYTACGIGSPVDSPGTFKPCVRTRIEAVAEGDFQVELSFKNREGVEFFRSEVAGSGTAIRYVQLPLYGEANKLFPVGSYVLTAKVKRRQDELGSASMAVEIR